MLWFLPPLISEGLSASRSVGLRLPPSPFQASFLTALLASYACQLITYLWHPPRDPPPPRVDSRRLPVPLSFFCFRLISFCRFLYVGRALFVFMQRREIPTPPFRTLTWRNIVVRPHFPRFPLFFRPRITFWSAVLLETPGRPYSSPRDDVFSSPKCGLRHFLARFFLYYLCNFPPATRE